MYVSLQTPRMYAHSCITTVLLCNVSLDDIASAEADRKVVRSLVSERKHILDCRPDDVNSDILCQNSRRSIVSLENGQCEKGSFGFLHVRRTFQSACMDARTYACICTRANRDVILTTLVNDDTVCSDTWRYCKLWGLSAQSIELVHRKRYLLHRVTRVAGI